jgi:hypothetical protein
MIGPAFRLSSRSIFGIPAFPIGSRPSILAIRSRKGIAYVAGRQSRRCHSANQANAT